MSEQPRSAARAGSADEPAPATQGGPAELASKPDANASKPDPENAPAAPRAPTAAEQMALYEESLKESDWGHQPC